MIPFRIYDRERKSMLVVLNYQPGNDGGSYLMCAENDQESDGELLHIAAQEMKKFKFVDFLEPAAE